MFVNNQKGSHGMFSKPGKQTLEKFQILLRKEEIMNGNNVKIKTNDPYKPDEVNNLDTHEDEFKIYSQEQKEKIVSSENALLKFKAKVKPIKVMQQKRQRTKKEKRKHENPPCTKYNPNWEYCNKKLIWGVKWETIKERNFSLINKETFNYKNELNLYKDKFTVDGKVFLDFNKQSKREAFHPNATASEFIERPDNTSNPYANANVITEESFSKKRKRGLSAKQKYNRILAPDFRKTISRAHLDKLNDDKKTVIPFSLPKYEQVWAKPKYLVKYDKMSSRKENKNDFYGGNGGISIHYDPNKILDKVNNHIETKSPNFDLMTSRPMSGKNDPLPSYMKNIVSRQTNDIITEKALKMNNFSQGRFTKTEDSFWPKKSYNKIINLNLLNSAKFIENIMNKNAQKEKGLKGEINAYIDKSIKFYNKNFEDLLKESMLTKFDSVTFKSIAKRKRSGHDLDKFLMNYENAN